ncbi:class I SAM-dependent methyltransferase [Bacillus marasmi]|uniref:class I SAM-dependent methyltransferase n=1 Tax=Bacillus marasmi TaxID=1926279 RepID=UPI0011C9F6DF|nr:class I SAM-dependent methyltransferase [Bacillus marasmi]
MNEENTYNPEKALAYERNTRISVPTYDALFEMIQSYFRAHINEKEAALLLVGAGGGNELSAWGTSNPEWSFTGVDPSEEMLFFAKNKAVQLGIEERVNLIEGTIEDLPLSDTKFDAASCILVLHFIQNIEDKLMLLKTTKKHLKPGAPFVLVCAYGDRDSTELQNRINVWKAFLQDAGFEKSKADERGKIIMNISFIPESQIQQLLTDAGFTNITRFYSTALFGGWICHAE